MQNIASALRFAVCVAVCGLGAHASRGLACGGYMMELPVVDREKQEETRAEVVALVRQAEAALELGESRKAIAFSAEAWGKRQLVRGAVDTDLANRGDAVGLAAIVFVRGGFGIDDGGIIHAAANDDEAGRILLQARTALDRLHAWHPDLAIAAEALAVANVLLAHEGDDVDTTRRALLDLYREGAVVMAPALAVVSAVADKVGADAGGMNAFALCADRAANAAVCDTQLPRPRRG